MAGEVFLHRFPLCILRIYLGPAVWQESSRSVSLIQMYPVSERCRTVVCALDAFFISHPSVQIISYNFYFFLIRNFAFGHKFLPLWKQCFISLSLIEGVYQRAAGLPPIILRQFIIPHGKEKSISFYGILTKYKHLFYRILGKCCRKRRAAERFTFLKWVISFLIDISTGSVL